MLRPRPTSLIPASRPGLIRRPAPATTPRVAAHQRQSNSEFWAREELIALLSVAGTLAGLSVTVVAFMDKPRAHATATTTVVATTPLTAFSPATTVVDDLFSLCALPFPGLCLPDLHRATDAQPQGFLLAGAPGGYRFRGRALTMMTAAGFVLVYTVLVGRSGPPSRPFYRAGATSLRRRTRAGTAPSADVW